MRRVTRSHRRRVSSWGATQRHTTIQIGSRRTAYACTALRNEVRNAARVVSGICLKSPQPTSLLHVLNSFSTFLPSFSSYLLATQRGGETEEGKETEEPEEEREEREEREKR